MARTTVVALALAGALTACGGRLAVAPESWQAAVTAPTPSPAPSEAATIDSTAIQALLDQAAAAFLAGDPEQLRGVLLNPEAAFGSSWMERAANMRDLPLASYRLTLDESLPDLATPGVRDRYGVAAEVRYVLEELQLDGFDDEPAAESLFLTIVPTDDGPRLASDRDAEALGLVSADHLWDHGSVAVTGDGPIVAIHHPDGPDVTSLIVEAEAALEAASARWPLDWPGRVPIVVPRDQDELGELLHVTFDLSNFVAFATATPVGERGEYRLTGSRVVINPDSFLRPTRSAENRRLILVHELTHVATRPVAGPMVPSWLEEGVAQAIGEQRSTTGTRLLGGLAASARDLPSDGQFTVGGSNRIFLSYQLAWSFLDYLTRAYGSEMVADFYAATGAGSIGEPGTEQHQVDRAAREVFGTSLADLLAGWRRS